MISENNQTPCYVWTRVSSREQEEGYSLQAQQGLIEDYLRKNNLIAKKTFIVQESAKQSDQRKKFQEMFKQLKEDNGCFNLVVHKTDRLARDIRDSSAVKDWIEKDERNQLHIVHEKMIMNKNSPSYQKFIFNINSTIANLYVDNLSEEVKKGMVAKAEAGIFPGKAPRGYKNRQSDDNKRSKRWIEVDEKESLFIKRMFELYSTDQYSLSDLSGKMYEDGMRTKDRKKGDKLLQAGNKLSKETIRQLLMDIFYIGQFKWKGKIYPGNHPALVERTVFDRVQNFLIKRTNGSRGHNRNFLFKGLIHCGECGRLVVGEFQKPHYVNYRCTLHKKNPEDTDCKQRKYSPELILEEQIVKALKEFTMPVDVLDALKQELLSKHEEDNKYHEQIVQRLEVEKSNTEIKLNRLHEMRIEKEVDANEYQKLKEKYRLELVGFENGIKEHQSFDNKKFTEAVNQLDVSKNPMDLWFRFDTDEKRKLMQLLFSNLLLTNKILLIQWKNPFDFLLNYKESRNSSG